MQVKKIKGADVVWGIEDFTTVGTCLSGSVKESGQREPVPNETGGTRGIVIYEIEYTITAEILYPAAGYTLKIGDTITLGGMTAYCVDVEKKAANKDFKKVSITALTYGSMEEGGQIASNSSQPQGGEGGEGVQVAKGGKKPVGDGAGGSTEALA